MKKLFLLLMTVITLSLCASAQTRTVQGTVVDAENGEELIGVSVSAGQGVGVATDASGHFSLKVPATAKNLTVSYVGYQTQHVAITDGNMVVRLQADNALLDPIVVVAFGQQKKSSFTGSAATVGSAEIEKTQVSNPLNALSGRVTGLQLSNASGAPGSANPTIRVRGFTTVNSSGNSPLYIVDGSPYTGNINSINTNDIESMTVLKDAASGALYGARGANGVIIITTKRAKLGEAKVTVDAKWGANSRATQDYNYVKDPAQYYELYYQSLYNYARMPKIPGKEEGSNIGGMAMSNAAANAWANKNMIDPDRNNSYSLAYNVYTVPEGQYLIGSNGKLNPNATLGRMASYRGQDFWLTPDNWLDYTYKSSLRQEYNVSITQGTDKSNIMASVGYLKNEGIVVAKSQFERFSARVAADFQAKPWLKVGASANYSHVEYDATASEGSGNSTGNIFAFAVGIPPIYPMFMRDGNKQIMRDAQNFPRYDYGAGLNAGLYRPAFNGSNAISDAILNVNNTVRNVFSGTVFGEVRFLKDFKFTSNNTLNLIEYRSTSTNNPYYGQMATQNGIVNKEHVRNTDMNLQQLLTWNHTFNQSHTVDLLAGHEYYKREMLSLSGSKAGMFDPSNTELDGAILADGPAASNKYTYNNEGWLFRGQYDYDSKYFASASYRRDASSRFHPDHRWGNFWSVGGAWIISKEDFFNADWVNMLKLKVSYGEQGNDNIGEFLYTDTYSLINSDNNPGVTPSHKGNKDITWEKNGNFNAGVEFDFFNSRLSGEINGFYRRTSDMLMYFTLPASYGFMGYYDNIGNVMNAGLEVELHGDIISTRDFKWNLSVNMTYLKNRITSLPEERKTALVDGVRGYSSGDTFYGEGEPMYTFFMPRYLGVEKETGLPLYEKSIVGADGQPTGEKTTTNNYSEATQQLCGTALAPVFGGFQTSFEYKGIDLLLMFNYQIGGKVYDSGYASLMSSPAGGGASNLHADLFNAWTPENPNSNTPRFIYGDLQSASSSSRFLTNASYLSLENINLGYTLPTDWIKKLYLEKLRVYFACENVWVWSKRQGLDPRQSFTGGNNNTYNAPVRTISGGLTITF